MKQLVITCLVALTCAGTARAQYVSLNDREIKSLKDSISTSAAYQKLFKPILVTADNALAEEPNPIEKIRSQGLLAGNPIKTASLKAVEDVYKVYALGLHYRLYGKKQYLNKAAAFLLAWAKTNKATGDPIDETKLEEMITGYDLVRGSLNRQDRQTVDNWMDSIYQTELHSEYIKPGRGTRVNNWNSHRVKLLVMIAWVLQNKNYQQGAVRELETQIGQNLNADGTGLDFLERDAFHYHIYTLEPLLRAAMVIKRANGKDYFTYASANGASIKKSTDFMVPYMTGEKIHEEFKNSKVKFDRDRAKNGEKGYEVHNFNPATAINTLSMADYFSDDYISIIKKVKGAGYFDRQLALNHVK